MELENIPTLKLVLIGDCNVGKTTFVERHLTGKFIKNYVPSLNANRNLLTFHTNRGKIHFDIWDCSGNEKNQEDNFKDSDGAIIMFDTTANDTYKSVKEWYNNFKKICPNAPVIIVGNKVDSVDRVVNKTKITFPKKHNLLYFDVSAKSNYNFEKPFLHMLRLIYNNDIVFLEN